MDKRKGDKNTLYQKDKLTGQEFLPIADDDEFKDSNRFRE